ncbi:hypothetical protein [Phyllobacterium sp. UNC302MFCol5.2]|uniref:hypothetical protein n=1 Tax=Phyllobacterium sp. UNC302MFCol5.2 TaxID=1449065 RepID=UPI0012DE73D1|nr:hypothetical protein [Phyllobacterium sp. UNC302MFCol5.2]
MSQNAELLAEIDRRAQPAKAADLNNRHVSKEVEDIHTQLPHRCEEYIKRSSKKRCERTEWGGIASKSTFPLFAGSMGVGPLHDAPPHSEKYLCPCRTGLDVSVSKSHEVRSK